MEINVTITGSSGFVGTNFIKRASEYNIREVDLLSSRPDQVDFSNCHTVLHLAASVHQMKGAPGSQYFKINRDLAFEVARKAKTAGVKHFVFMSTAKVYGESTNGKPAWNEKSNCYPLDPYGKSKYEAEKLILELHDNDFKVAVVRSPLVYGAGVKANMYNLIRLIDKYPILPLGGIHNRRSIVFIGNLVMLLKCIIDKQASGIFIAGDQTSLSSTQLTYLIAKGLNKRVILLTMPDFIIHTIAKVKPAIFDRLFSSLELDNNNSNKILNFIPPYSTEHGIQKMIEWYKDEKGNKKGNKKRHIQLGYL